VSDRELLPGRGLRSGGSGCSRDSFDQRIQDSQLAEWYSFAGARVGEELNVAECGEARSRGGQRVRRSSEDLQSMQSSAYGIASKRSRGIFLEQRAHTPYFLFSTRAIADSMS